MITIKHVSLIFLLLGALFLAQVSLPLIGFKVWESVILSGINLTSPQPPDINSPVWGVTVENRSNFPAIVSSLNRVSSAPYSNFSLEILRLKKNFLVGVDSNDLDSGPVQLPGSALPGEKGNLFISGHSALPVFSSSGVAPFANLTNLKKGDLIKISAAGVDFTYQIFDIKIVDPKNLSIIAPPDNTGRYLTLMTCVPPGLNTKRFIVVGKLI
ncbi:MAG: sortase [Candidatus Daviesbacteria bacterium]|nr:MAG: sortase [Candidatus Daviesbacteria bacterium]